MKAEIISVGTEILIGSILNSNQQYLSRVLAELGIDVYYHTTVGDNPARIGDALCAAFLRSDLVIITGGLGPTADDVTLESAAKALGFRLVVHQPTLRAIRTILARKKLRLTPNIANQARIPEGALAFRNHYGTAPGILKSFAHPRGLRHILLLPGPPREMAPMFEAFAAPVLRRLAGAKRGVFVARSLRIHGVPEADVAAKVDDLLRLKPPVTMGIYAKPAEVELKIMAKADSRAAALEGIARVERTARRRLGRMLILPDDETLEGRLGTLLKRRHMTVAAAESCTGGLLGSMITAAAGSSGYFVGSIVAYQNRIKATELGVSKDVLRRYGAVSAECSLGMANGVRKRFDAGLGISITGIAGPDGGTAAKPVGLVYIGVSCNGAWRVRKCFFVGKRDEVRLKAAKSALLLAVEFLGRRIKNEPPNPLKDEVRI